VRRLGTSGVQRIATSQLFYDFTWAQDSRHVLFQWDPDGSENTRVMRLDVDQPEKAPVELTPAEGARAWLRQVPLLDPEHVLVEHNGRDPTEMDLYRVALATGEAVAVAQGADGVIGWVTDPAGRVLARSRRTGPDGAWALELLEPDGSWRTAFSCGPYEVFAVVDHPVERGAVLALSNRARERTALVRANLETGAEQVLHQEREVDVMGAAAHPETHAPVSTWSFPDRFAVRWFDEELGRDLALLDPGGPHILQVLSLDRGRRKATVAVSSDRASADYWLLDRDAKRTERLGQWPLYELRDRLAEMRPVRLTARDGVVLHGYLTVPPGAEGPLPTVVKVHGGPWLRDVWGYDPVAQFLANRGYAVLEVNYRGSSGYGRSFLQAARGQLARAMHDDLVDAVRWAVAEGVTDPERVAIYGRSFGGYAALVGLAFTPEVFAAGVSIVGFADVAALIEDFPPYWKHWMFMWRDFAGDPSDPAQRAELEARSPLHRVDRIERPLLVAQGANDVRVLRDQSDRLVAALRARGRDVRYLVFDDEGHAIQRWQSQVVLHRAIEDFLAEHLGGRSGPREWVELAARLF
jgi:dipeptidyl aminopeptidase/acylaminoacyl peptidase